MKKILNVILYIIILVGITGCSNKKETVSMDDLNKINDKIIEYFNDKKIKYDNFCFNYIDEKNKVIVVGLLDNSKKEQEKFKKNVVDSDLIKFVQGSQNINYYTTK